MVHLSYILWRAGTLQRGVMHLTLLWCVLVLCTEAWAQGAEAVRSQNAGNEIVGTLSKYASQLPDASAEQDAASASKAGQTVLLPHDVQVAPSGQSVFLGAAMLMQGAMLASGKEAVSGAAAGQSVQAEAASRPSHWTVLYSCLEGLPEEQKSKASAIVDDSLPLLQDLDTRISGKMDELKSLTYSTAADPEALPKLGLDLQRLRDELRQVLWSVNMRLQKEAGVQLQDPSGRGCRSMRVYAIEQE